MYHSADPLSALLFSPDSGEFDGGGDIEEASLHQLQRHLVHISTSRTDAVFQNHHLVSEITRASRRAFDTAFGRHTANHNRFDPITPEHQIEVCADECVWPALL